MKRSNLTTKFMLGNVDKFEKSFKERYKKENDSAFKGNVLSFITVGVIQTKKIPDISDVLTLIKLGNSGISDEQASGILERYLADEDNADRGVLGAFCDACKDLCIDLPLNKVFVDQVNSLEETSIKLSEVMNQLSSIMTKLTSFKDKAESVEEKVDTIDTDKKDNEELGTKEDSTQE